MPEFPLKFLIWKKLGPVNLLHDIWMLLLCWLRGWLIGYEQMNQHGLSPTLIWAMLLQFIGILFIHTLGKLSRETLRSCCCHGKGATWGCLSSKSKGFPLAPEVGVNVSLPTTMASLVGSQWGQRNCCQEVISPPRTGVGCPSPQFWVRELKLVWWWKWKSHRGGCSCRQLGGLSIKNLVII